MSDAVIKVENLSKKFVLSHSNADEREGSHELWALKDISFEVKKGESVGILGPNGGGKSTLLKVLAGITKPSSGTVEIQGRVASILEIGAGFHPELTGAKNIYLGAQLLGCSKNEVKAKFDEIVTFSEIGEFIHEPVKTYSNGMFLRLAFSTLIHLDFDVYLFDEVFSVGDARFTAKIRRTLDQLTQSDKTVMLVSHQFDELSRQGTYLYLENGVVRSRTFNKDILVQYLNESVIETSGIEVVTHDIDITDFGSHFVNSGIHLNSVKLYQPDNPEGPFRSNLPFYIEVDFTRTENEKTHDVLLSFEDLKQNVLFFTTPLVASKVNDCLERGRYRHRCIIPAYTFNSRVLSLSITFLQNTKQLLGRSITDEVANEIKLFGIDGLQVCARLSRIVYFKPLLFGPNNIEYDFSGFDINCSLVLGCEWTFDKV